MTGELDVVAVLVALVSLLAPVVVIGLGLRVIRWLVEDTSAVPYDAD